MSSESDVHPDFEGRLKKIIANDCPTTNDKDGHSTHVAGCTVADGGSFEDASIKETAPVAESLMQVPGSTEPPIPAPNWLGAQPTSYR